MARPKKNIDEKKVLEEAQRFSTYEEIAEQVGCSADTLSRRFADTIEKGHTYARRSLRGKQYDLAMKGNVTMLIWLGKQYLGQTDKAYQDIKHSGGVMIVESQKDENEWLAIMAERRAAISDGNGRG